MPDCKERDDFAYIFLTIQLIITVFALTINLFIIYAKIKYKYLKCPTNTLVTYLAVSDFLTALCIPYYVSFYFDVSYKCEKYACLVRHMSIMFATMWSLLLMTGIAVDRYIAVVKSLRYASIITGRKVLTFVVSTAIYMGVLCILPLFDVVNRYDPGTITECDLYFVVSAAYAVPVICGHVGFAVVTSTLLYWRVFRTALKCKQMTPELEANIACTMFMLFGVRLFVYCPYLLAVLLRYVVPESGQDSLGLANKITTVLYFSKTVLSPLISAGRNAGFRAALRHTFGFPTRDASLVTSAESRNTEN